MKKRTKAALAIAGLAATGVSAASTSETKLTKRIQDMESVFEKHIDAAKDKPPKAPFTLAAKGCEICHPHTGSGGGGEPEEDPDKEAPPEKEEKIA